ncbi:MAG: 1-acyl-sn-glycerol-3-phosphate acyltransferase [Propionibacteriaceae bacterium]|jgi:1-acyl-sn-glycerol-3-phosphate acyltransferase|nr:1-acyl-sn-glycerol-3-phosphate acyltransferase [Propionibacteriaceae bacterium]
MGMFYWFIKILLIPLATILFWPKVTGRENIPATGPAIIFGNHLGIGEAFLVPGFVRPKMVFPVKGEIFNGGGPFKRFGAWFLKAIGMVPMDRTGGRSASDALGSISGVLENGGFVGFFPEGHRSPDGRLYRGRTGIARLAIQNDAVLVPLGCFGTRFVRKWLPWPWLFRPELRFSEPFKLPAEMVEAFNTATDATVAGQVLREATDYAMRRVQAITGQEWVDEYSLNPKKAKRKDNKVS